MLELTWAKLNEKAFCTALMTLNNSKLDNVTGYRVGRIVEVAKRELEKAGFIEMKRAEELATRNEKGEIEYLDTPSGKRPKLSEEADTKLTEEMQKILAENKVDIKVNKLDFNALTGLTGEQLVAIADICDNLPE